MQILRILLILVMVPFVGMACMAAPNSGIKVTSAQGALGVYDGVHQWANAGGRQIQKLDLNARFNEATITHTKQDVIVPGAPSVSVPPQQPKYGRAAKAVPRTPPARPAPAPKVVTLNTTTTVTGPVPLSSTGGEGPTTAHSVQAGLALSVPTAAGVVGGNAVAPGTDIAIKGVGIGKGGSAAAAATGTGVGVGVGSGSGPAAGSGAGSGASGAGAGN